MRAHGSGRPASKPGLRVRRMGLLPHARARCRFNIICHIYMSYLLLDLGHLTGRSRRVLQVTWGAGSTPRVTLRVVSPPAARLRASPRFVRRARPTRRLRISL